MLPCREYDTGEHYCHNPYIELIKDYGDIRVFSQTPRTDDGINKDWLLGGGNPELLKLFGLDVRGLWVSVSGFGLLLRSSQYIGNYSVEKALTAAKDSVGYNQNGYRREFVDLLRKYQQIR